MNFFQKFRDFVASPSHSRTMGILMIFVLAAAVSVTVIASQQRQTTKQRASNEPSCASYEASLPTCNVDIGTVCNKSGDRCRAINSQGLWEVHTCK